MNLILYFNQVHRQDVLIHLPVVLARLEAQHGIHQLARIEAAHGQLTQHRSHIRVFVLATRLLQHDVALRHLPAFGLLTLHGEGLALRHHFHDSFHRSISYFKNETKNSRNHRNGSRSFSDDCGSKVSMCV